MVATTSSRPVAEHAASSPVRQDRELSERLWSEDLPREHGFEPLVVEGTIPRELRGTIVRNGPGLFGQFGRRYSHPFEADGAATAIRLADGAAHGASRITASAGLAEERAAGRIRYGATAPWLRRVSNGLRGRQKNTANTNVLAWQGRLFGLVEAARPTELDPRDLSTIGETDLGGVLGDMFSAHPHRVAARRAIYNFGLEYGRVTKLHMYELPDEGGARHLGAIQLAGPPMLHDFIATETHLVFFVSPVRVHIPRMLLQIGAFQDLFRWRPQHGVEVICVPIDRPTEPVRFTVDAFYQWHFANAFTRGREIIVDYVRYPTFDSFYEIGDVGAGGAMRGALAQGRAHRATIDLDARTLRSEQLSDRNCEFPTIADTRSGTEHGTTYLVLDELRAIGRLDARTGELVSHTLPATQRATEAIYVPRNANAGAAVGGAAPVPTSAERDGWLLSLCHDAPSSRAFLAVYDAARIPDGPVARAWFDHQIPITFHGTWMSA